MIRRLGPAAGMLTALVCVLGLLAATAAADVQTIDFDSEPPALGAPLNSQGDVTFPLSLGFRPYRTEVGELAHSGTVVGDLGRCVQETEASNGGASCEAFQANTTGVLARTAKSVTLFAGRLGPPLVPTEESGWAILRAFAANGVELDHTGLVALGESFDAPLTVSSDTGDIAKFSVEAKLGPEGQINEAPFLGIDDVTVNFTEGGEPDFAVTTTSDVVAVVDGESVEVPVEVPRINGSHGPIELTVSGLPKGVTALPVTVGPGDSSATITLTAAPNAPDTDFHPVDATIKADPLGNPDVGAAARTTILSVRVATDFDLTVPGRGSSRTTKVVNLELPECGTVDVPLQVGRDITMNRDVSLSFAEASPGLQAEILPDALVHPGGNLVAERTMRFRSEAPGSTANIMLLGVLGGNDVPSHSLQLHFEAPASTATIANATPGSGSGSTPRYNKEGTRIRIHGSGFCQGTTVEVGNSTALIPATVVNGQTLEFVMPLGATSGPVTIYPGGGGKKYKTSDELSVDNFRNTNAFHFENYPVRGISISEFLEAFGPDDVFVSVNPCWPFGDCSVSSGILDPLAVTEYHLMNVEFLMPGSGHCFGIDQTQINLMTGKVPYRRFAGNRGGPPAKNAFGLAGPESGSDPHSVDGPPPDELDSYLDAEQIKTNSAELTSAWMGRPKSLQAQVNLLAREFRKNRPVSIVLNNGGVELHTVLAFNSRPTDDGVDIDVANSNAPFETNILYGNDENTNSKVHAGNLEYNVIHVDLKTGQWRSKIVTGEADWRGDNDGSLWAIPYETVPENASLPGLQSLYDALSYMHVRSDRIVRAIGKQPPAVLALIAADEHASGGSATYISRHPGRPMDLTLEAVKNGTYSQGYIAPGFIANVSGVSTSKGVRDHLSGEEGAFTLQSGRDRPLRMEVARRVDAAQSSSAILRTHASGGGSDEAGIAGDGAVTYAHDGAPTSLSFQLTTVRRNGGPATFVSDPVQVRNGDHLRIEQIDRALRRVRVVVRDAHGHLRTRILANQGRARFHLQVRAPRSSGRQVSVPFRLTGLRGKATLGATLRLLRNGHAVAHRSLALKVGKGTHRIHWQLPRRLARGHYRLVTGITAIARAGRTGLASASVSRRRVSGVRVG